MDKDSIFELQKIDCNCNDCMFMTRDIEKFKTSLAFQEKMQRDLFDKEVSRMKEKAKWWLDKKGDLEKWNDLLIESEKMKFVFDKSTAMINFGKCSKFNKDVSFIPNTCQLDTQKCFVHRRSITNL